ncbi:MAG: site-specific DNA-methyltransferase [Gammaproteobacteria bacterium]|nr:MAG: site-specific DNA-methyltransferase [Gammaproteobacteria bacterium]
MKNYDNFSKKELLKLVKKQDAELAKKKYGLVWDSEKVPEKVVTDCEQNIPILDRVYDKEIKTDDSDDNILIEGDNYHALMCLNYTHEDKIDVIYIDPPYNTGNKDFVYNDDYVDQEDGYRHSKWLNFMEKRLLLARNLLKETGVIFISIDDNEMAQLKLLCDDVFGAVNFLGNLTWIKKTKPVNSGKAKKQIQQNIEYVLCYLKSKKNNFSGFKLKTQGARIYNKKGKLGNCRFKDIEDSDYGRKKRDTMKFPILNIKPAIGKRWKIGKEEIDRLIDENRIEIVNSKIKVAIYPQDEKNYIKSPFWSHLDRSFVGTAETGKKELSEILTKNHNFDTVKPLGLIKELLFHFPKNITILDFFAGSGTTGHAILESNKKDGGNRKIVLCTNNELNGAGSDLVKKNPNEEKEKFGICQRVTFPRLEKVINGYKKNGNGEFIDGLGGNLQYFKTSLIPVDKVDKVTDEQKIELTYKAGQMIAIKENTFEEVETNEWYQIFENKDKSRKTAIYFREDLGEFQNLIKKMNNTKTILYVFSYVAEIDKDVFFVNKNIDLKAIPEPIIKLYQRINLTTKRS